MYVIITRPYKETNSNIIEIINEIYFTIFLSSLIFFNEENDWNSTKSSVYNSLKYSFDCILINYFKIYSN